MAFNPAILPTLLDVPLQLGLAVLLLYSNFNKLANRALALVLVIRACFHATSALPSFFPDASMVAYFHRLGGYFVLTLPLAILFVASVYPRRRFWVPREPYAPLPFIALMVLVDVLYARDHGLLDEGQPLSYVRAVLYLIYPAIAILLVREYAGSPPARRDTGALFVALAFALIEFHDEIVSAWQTTHGGGVVNGFAWGEGVVGRTVLTLDLSLFALLLALYAWYALRHAEPDASRAMRRSLAAVLVCGASAVASIALAGGGTVSTTPFDVFVTGFWDLSLPLLVTYAVVRHQLFGIDLKIKWTIKRGAVAAVFLAVIFMVSQLAQNWLSQSQGLVVGSSVAGIMLFAIAPIQRFAERLSDKALPNAKPAERMDEGERAAIYLDVARSAWRDGNITKDERRLLKELQTRLGLSAEAAQRIEDQAMA